MIRPLSITQSGAQMRRDRLLLKLWVGAVDITSKSLTIGLRSSTLPSEANGSSLESLGDFQIRKI